MLQFITLCFLFLAVHGHSSKLQDEADSQSSLMPQELNPDTITQKDQPWKAVMPLLRARRDISTDVESSGASTSIASAVKRYSRIIACVVLALSSIIEIVLYILDIYLA